MKDATFADIPYKVASLTKGSSPIGSQFDNIPVYALLRDSNLLTLNSRLILLIILPRLTLVAS